MKKTQQKRGVWSPESQVSYVRGRIERASSWNQPALREFTEWLASARCLGPGTIRVRVWCACAFVDEVTARAETGCIQAFESVGADEVEDFFVRYGKDHGIAARRSMRTAMRSFLQFAADRGWVGRELAEAVPSLRGYRLSGLPCGLNDEQLSTLLGWQTEGSHCARRDLAIVVLLASYGVRRGQVSALRLADIDWRERTVDFAAHKGGKAIRQVLTDRVAESLADYLRNERPASDCDHVFLRARRPYLRLGPGAISEMVIVRMQRCGLPPRGPHVLRHSFATRLLRAGQPLKAISDLLGHRSLDAVAVYAKVDHVRLFEAAVDWPEAVS